MRYQKHLFTNGITVEQYLTLQDNYVWVIQQGHDAWVIDPNTDTAWFKRDKKINLKGIFITHHHNDHTGGIPELSAIYPDIPIYGPSKAVHPMITQVIHHADIINLNSQLLCLQAISTPGHTAHHMSYLLSWHNKPLIIFCGDTLFSGGCGRIMPDGSWAKQFWSLATLRQLPDTVLVACSHEYTINNLKFALSLEPDNTDIDNYLAHCQQLVANHQFTIPSTIEREKAINPFLRTHLPTLQHHPKCASMGEWILPEPLISNPLNDRLLPEDHKAYRTFCQIRYLKNQS